MDAKLGGKVALVTGAGQGIGRAIAVALAREGARVALMSRRRPGLEETLALIGRSNGLVVPGDVTDDQAVTSAVGRVVAHFGGLDVVVNNAGQRGRLSRVEDLEVQEWERIVAVNLSSVFYVSRAAAPHLIRQRSGSVVNIASIAGPFAFPRLAANAAAKAGMIGLTKTMAAEWSEFGVRVNAVAPGPTATPMNAPFRSDPATAQQVAAVEAAIPLGRYGLPNEVADAVVFLAGATGSFVTGHTLFVDGGWSVV